MKIILLSLMFLPCMAQAQEEQPAKQYNPKNEIGLSTGYAPSFLNRYSNYLYSGKEPWLTARLTYLRNFKNTQLGLTLEGGELDWDDGSVVAAVALNQKFPVGRSYLYAGGSTGFYYAKQMSKPGGWTDRNERGYTLGLQAGLSLYLTDHFAFVSEVGFRNTQVWFENYNRISTTNSWGGEDVEWYRFMDSRFSIALPATVGIRYRF